MKLRLPVCKLCRKQQVKLFLKGERCKTKCPLDQEKKKTRSFSKKFKFRKSSEYGFQLKEKKKVQVFYGVTERELQRYFEAAGKKKGIIGEELLLFLERRLDNVIYGLRIVPSRRMARQIINHGDIFVNDRRTNRPSYQVKMNDVIFLKCKSKFYSKLKEMAEKRKKDERLTWLEFSPEKLSAKIIRLPARSDVTVPVNEGLLMDFYSK